MLLIFLLNYSIKFTELFDLFCLNLIVIVLRRQFLMQNVENYCSTVDL